MDELLPIGEFSARSGLSAKKLRNYAAAGILTPAAVDRSSGYRYYAPSQLDRAETISLLRKAGVPLADIARFLASPSRRRMDAWERDLQGEVASRRRALSAARAHLGLETETAYSITGGEPAMDFTSAMATDVGLVRAANQDAAATEGAVFAVADGCGTAGEVASRLAVETVASAFPVTPTHEGLRAACLTANRAVWRRVRDDERLNGTGTTLTAAGVVTEAGAPSLALVSVGDSRAYLVRDGHLRRLTNDHTVVAELVRAGELSEQQAREHPRRAVLTRVLGLGPDVEADVTRIDLEEGDRVLLCSDGLSAHVEEDDIETLLSTSAAADVAADALVALANKLGGHDNVTVVVIDAQ